MLLTLVVNSRSVPILLLDLFPPETRPKFVLLQAMISLKTFLFVFTSVLDGGDLGHFSAAELRVKCVTAVHDELLQAETQLHPALEALKRALSVVQASRKMYRAPLGLVDESPDISKALE
ncbi:hypothetical protein GQ600_16586 [Phytophthora cactorum]|nr:hypothetical protein GQ600_16586 [Phytophthora cactorum]